MQACSLQGNNAGQRDAPIRVKHQLTTAFRRHFATFFVFRAKSGVWRRFSGQKEPASRMVGRHVLGNRLMTRHLPSPIFLNADSRQENEKSCHILIRNGSRARSERQIAQARARLKRWVHERSGRDSEARRPELGTASRTNPVEQQNAQRLGERKNARSLSGAFHPRGVLPHSTVLR